MSSLAVAPLGPASSGTKKGRALRPSPCTTEVALPLALGALAAQRVGTGAEADDTQCYQREAGVAAAAGVAGQASVTSVRRHDYRRAGVRRVGGRRVDRRGRSR